jgi:hypothetical protein
LVALSLAANPTLIARHRMMTASAIFVASLLPSLEELGQLSFLFLVLGSTTTIALLTDPQFEGLRAWLSDLRQLFVTGPLRLLPDAARALRGPGLTPASWSGSCRSCSELPLSSCSHRPIR